MAITSPGIGSGLDINGIISKLMSVEQQPLTKLNTKEASYQSKISALGTLKGAVSSLDTALSALVPTSSATPTITASINNSSVALVTASSTAETGSYEVSIDQLATAHKIATISQAHRLVSGVYGGTLDAIDQGTLNLAVGYNAAIPITVNSSNATLTGLKNAINAAGAGVTADIVPADGGGVRLVLTSNTIGAAGQIVTSGLNGFDFDGSSGSLSQEVADGGRAASGYNTANDTVATGTLDIQVGSGSVAQVVIDSTNNTLLGLKNAINASSAGVTAELVTVGTNNIRLVMTANGTGSDSIITTTGLTGFEFDGSLGTGDLSESGSEGGQSAQDASITVDGTTYTSSINTVTTAITDVTLRLISTTTTAATVTVERSEGTSFAAQASAKFRTFKGTVGDSGVASATVSASAVSGSYAFEVVQLATTHRITTPPVQAHQITTAPPKPQALRSGAYLSTSTDITDGTDGTLDFALAGGGAFTVDVLAGTTLDDLKTLINEDAENAGVTASIATDGGYSRLVLTSSMVGAAGEMTVTNSGGITGFDYDSGSDSGSLYEFQATQGYSSSAETIAEGTLSIAVGDGSAIDVTIDGSNSTLAGLRDAINNAGAGVTASIVQEGLGVRLLVESDTVGRNGAITLSGITGFEFNDTTRDLSEETADGGAAAQGYTSADTLFATGTLQIGLGSGTTHNIEIDSSNNTLEGIKDAINSSSYGVSATLVTAGTGDVRLILTSNTIGTDGAISLSGIDGLEFDAGSGSGDFSQETADGGTAAQGSIIKLNGVTIAGESNTVSDALQGVTLNLTAVSTSATTLTVSQEKTSSLSSSMTAIVKSYNELIKSITDLGKYDEKTKTGGPLLGNSTLRQVSYSIRNSFQTAPVGLTSPTIKRLSDIGLEVQKDGTLTFDTTRLSSATSSDYDAVALLAASFGKVTKTLTTSMLGTRGTIPSATDGLSSSVEDISKQREVISRRLIQIEARYRRQFSALDTLVASMNSTSSYLQQQLSKLPSASSSSS